MATSPPFEPRLYDRAIPLASDREALTHALEQSDERFQMLVRRVNVGVFRALVDGPFIEVNPALVRMLGYACESELLAIHLGDALADPLEAQRLHQRLERGPVDRVSSRLKRKDGSAIAVRLSMREVRQEDGHITFLDGIVDDVTDRQRQQELLRRT